jgi:hypothetical protein
MSMACFRDFINCDHIRMTKTVMAKQVHVKQD